MNGLGLADYPALASDPDISAQKEYPQIWHIILAPNMGSFVPIVYVAGERVDSKYYDDYFRCRPR